MANRYDFMKQALIAKDVDGEPWPDPLTINYSNVRLSQIPTSYKIAAGDIAKFWLTNYREYGTTEGDDIWLSLNGIPYIGMFELGDDIFKFALNDIENFHTQKLITDNLVG